MELNIISLTEANLNRVVSGKDKTGYAILSASPPISKESIDVDNIRTNELLSFLNISNCTYVPVYGKYRSTCKKEFT